MQASSDLLDRLKALEAEKSLLEEGYKNRDKEYQKQIELLKQELLEKNQGSPANNLILVQFSKIKEEKNS